MNKLKTPSQSAVESRYILMPDQANPQGTAFGGTIVGWMDLTAAMAAQRHAEKEVVTAAVDSITFEAPIHIGDHVIIQACVNYVGRTSMEVGVRVSREDPYSGKQTVATTAHFTFVALDQNKKPSPVPALSPQTPLEKKRYASAEKRAVQRKKKA